MSNPGPLLLEEALPGEEWASARQALVANGKFDMPNTNYRMHAVTRKVGAAHEVLSLAAVSRDPGTTQDLIDQIADFQAAASKPQAQKVQQYYQIAKTEGLIANAIRKLAAFAGQGGRWVVRRAKKGRWTKAREEAQALLDWVRDNINTAPLEGVVTASKGLQAVNHQAARVALIEGSWVGRTVWNNVLVGALGKQYSLPTNVVTVSTQFLEPVKEIVGTGIEAFYWKPPAATINQLVNPTNKDVAKLLKKYIPKEYLTPLRRDRQVLLDPALLLHVKHRPLDSESFGQSFLEPCLTALAFKRNVEALDYVTTKTLINRLTIVTVGSTDPNSPYADQSSILTRQAILARMLADPAPNSLIVWGGQDIDFKDIGAFSEVLQLDGRHKIARQMLLDAIGIPLAILSGESSDAGSRASGWAAAMAGSAECLELLNSLQVCWDQLGQRILVENGYQPGDIEVVWQWDNSLLVDKNTEYSNLREDYQLGAISITTYLKGRGFDADAEFAQKCLEAGIESPDQAVWTEVFKPVVGLPGQASDGTPNTGRKPGTTTPPEPSQERPGTNTPR